MIARYNGLCHLCGLPTKAGVDQYDVATKKNWHEGCEGSGGTELADALGFRTTEELADDRVLRDMLLGNRGASTGRPESKAPTRQESTLFGEEQ